MQQQTCITARAHVQVGSPWIDRAHQHRLAEVAQIPDDGHVRLQPDRESCHQPPSYLERAARLASDYERVLR